MSEIIPDPRPDQNLRPVSTTGVAFEIPSLLRVRRKTERVQLNLRSRQLVSRTAAFPASTCALPDAVKPSILGSP